MKIIKKNCKDYITAFALSKYIRISPIKLRCILLQLKGRSAQEACFLLEFISNKSCRVILKVLKAALANAASRYGKNSSSFFISKAIADGSSSLKRFQPRSQGRAFPIKKPFSNILIMYDLKYLLKYIFLKVILNLIKFLL
jgi:large subunit ribosomal protein L22